MSRVLFRLTVCLLLSSLLCITKADTECKVTLKSGPIEGVIIVDFLNPLKKTCSFLSIPYAAPPVGTLRFEPPQPVPPWTATLQVNHLPKTCPQANSHGNQTSEDCLYLNVYQAKAVTNPPKEGLPVMIFIHGGAFTSGNSHHYTSARFLTRADIILVVIQYRLGLLGFFSTGDNTVPGNNGLKDQALAIRWVHENIPVFGGNPNKVTIFGCSAGGASVTYQYISPLNKGLFHGAIAQSGSALAPWAINRYPSITAKIIAKRLGCPEKTNAMVGCLKKLSWEKIVNAQGHFGKESMTPVIEPKSVKGAFITEDPAVLMKSGNIPDIPLMIGATKHDGSFLLAIAYTSILKPHGLDKNKDYMRHKIVPDFLKFFGVHTLSQDNKMMASAVELAFLSGVNRSSWNDSVNGLVDIASVFAFKSPAETTSELISERNRKVYLYSFDYHSKSFIWSTLFGKEAKNIPVSPGVAHGDELFYLFNFGELSEQDKKVSNIMLDMWLNFAKFGNPTPSPDSRFQQWSTYNSESEQYITLDTKPSMQIGYRNSWKTNGFN